MIKDAYGNTRFFGLYRGVVVTTSSEGILTLKVPQVFANQVTGPAVPVGNVVGSVPAVDEGVWVMFEGGDTSYPLWVGKFTPDIYAVSPADRMYIQQVPERFYGAFQSTASTQTAPSITTAYPVTFTTTDYSNEVALEDNSKIRIFKPGVYNIQFSIQFKNTDTVARDVRVWFRKNGVDVSASGGEISVPGKHGSLDGHTIGGYNILLEVIERDYIELMWASTEASTVSIITAPALTSPATTSSPGVILTVVPV